MPRTLSDVVRQHKNQLRDELPFIWLFGVQKVVGGERYRFCSYPQVVFFGEDSEGNRIPWYPAPIVHGGIEHDAEGGLPSLDITLANVSLEIAPEIDAEAGFLGKDVEIHCISAADIDAEDAAISEFAQVTGCSMTAEAIAFTVAAYNLFEAQFPPYTYSKTKCRWAFGKSECGYNTAASGAGFADCGLLTTGERVATGFTLEACELVGADEAANPSVGVVQHPRNAGFFPGIPRGGRR